MKMHFVALFLVLQNSPPPTNKQNDTQGASGSIFGLRVVLVRQVHVSDQNPSVSCEGLASA